MLKLSLKRINQARINLRLLNGVNLSQAHAHKTCGHKHTESCLCHQSRGFAAANKPDMEGSFGGSSHTHMDHSVADSVASSSGARKGLPIMPHFDYTPPKYTGPSLEQIKAMRVKHVSPMSFHFYREPVLAVEGKMQYLFDHTGKRYLDFITGISTTGLGHCNPRINAAMIKQIERLQHITTIYLNDVHSQFAEELCAKLPEQIEQVFFTSSGGESNSYATQLARLHTKNWSIMALANGYHGHAGGNYMSNVGSYNLELPKTQGVELAPFPDMYRCPFPIDEAPQRYAEQMESNINYATPGKMALMMMETVQGNGGCIPINKEFVQRIIPMVKKAGGLLLSDEVQTGFGRLGTHYWGCERVDYKADIMTMAKHIGNGIPLACIATTKDVADTWREKGKMTFSTFGANPIAMAAGREILKTIDEDGLQERARVISEYCLKGMKYLEDKYECVGQTRGHGLMMAIELVKDKESKEPAQKLFDDVWEKTKDYGLLLGKGGRWGTVFRIQPSMMITEEDIDFAIEVIDRSIGEVLAGQ